jgi:hypothetical protein
MTYSESYDRCMAQKGLPLLGEVFSEKSFVEAVAILHEIHTALEGAGGMELTLAALAAAGPALGLSADALEVAGLLAAGSANVAAQLYVSAAISCIASAAITGGLLSELDAVPDGFVKDQILSEADNVMAVA